MSETITELARVILLRREVAGLRLRLKLSTHARAMQPVSKPTLQAPLSLWVEKDEREIYPLSAINARKAEQDTIRS